MGATTKAGNAPVQAAALPEAAKDEPTGPLHKAFQWADPMECERIPAYSAIEFFNLTRDIADGAAVALGIVERCQMEMDEEVPRPLLSTNDQFALMRLTIGALKALRSAAEDKTEWINDRGPEYKARESRA